MFCLFVPVKLISYKLQVGQELHKKCREELIHPLNLYVAGGDGAGTSEDKSKTRSTSDSSFNYKTDCIFCTKRLLHKLVYLDVSFKSGIL